MSTRRDHSAQGFLECRRQFDPVRRLVVVLYSEQQHCDRLIDFGGEHGDSEPTSVARANLPGSVALRTGCRGAEMHQLLDEDESCGSCDPENSE